MKTNARIYIMVDNEGRIKLGHSVNPMARSKQMPRPVTLVHETDVIEQAERVERLAHRILALHGTHLRGEWFEASLEDALQAIEIAIRQAEQEELALGGWMNGKADIKTSTPEYHILNFRADPETLESLDKLRRDEPDIPTRSEMARRIIKRACDKADRKTRKS